MKKGDKMAKRSKKDMINEMQEFGWSASVTEKDSYEDVKSEYEIFKEEYNDDSILFPNGRDFDAEDEDGPF